MSTYTITARLTTAVIEPDRHPIMIDGLLAYAKALDGTHPPITPEHAPTIALPLDKHEADTGAWCWKASAAHYNVERYTTAQIRRKPDTEAMAKYGKFGKHHIGLGPHKAKNITLEAGFIREMSWVIETNEIDEVVELLKRITGIGRGHSSGYGKIESWVVTPGGDPNGWKQRKFMPGNRLTPPYWHPTERRNTNAY